MKLPPDVEFHEDIRLFVYRPRGSIDEAAINKITSVIEDLEAATQEPFNRFSDTSKAHEVELNFKYVIQVSLCRRLSYAGHPPVKSAILATDSTMIHYADSRFSDPRPRVPRSQRRRGLVKRTCRTIDAKRVTTQLLTPTGSRNR